MTLSQSARVDLMRVMGQGSRCYPKINVMSNLKMWSSIDLTAPILYWLSHALLTHFQPNDWEAFHLIRKLVVQ